MLKLTNVSASYGRIEALHGISLEVPDGKIVALLGANGAGKTTTLRVITGILRPTWGSVTFDGQDISRMETEEIVPLGIAMSPEGRQIFTGLTVAENLRMGSYTRKDKAGVEQDLEWVLSLFPRLKERYSQVGATLSGGEQQMLAIARALVNDNQLLLIDEPSKGLAPVVIERMAEVLAEISREVTILLVEQNFTMAAKLGKTCVVIDEGRTVYTGPMAELAGDPRLQQRYLGVGGQEAV